MAYTPLPTPNPSGDQWGEQLNDAIGDRTNDKIKRIIAGRGLHVDTSDPQQPVISRTDIDLLGLQNYRGEWVDENALIYSQDFSDIPSSTTLPPELLLSTSFALTYDDALPSASDAWSIVPTDTSSPIETDFPFSIHTQSLAGKYFTIYLPKISTFRYQIHTIKFWHKKQGTSSCTTNVMVDGSILFSVAETDTYVESTFTGFNAYNTITLNPLAGGSVGARYTGIRLYGRILTSPYVMGDIVSHEGVLYKCIYSTTQQEPGTGAHWEVVPYTMLPPGAPYTEAINATVTRSDARVEDKYDPLWGAPSVYDLELDSDTSSLPSGWTWTNQGSSSYSQRFGCGVVSTGSNEDPAYTIRGISRNVPTETSWTATAKIVGTNLRSSEAFGLILEDNTAGSYVTFSKALSGISVRYYSNFTTMVSETSPFNTFDTYYFRIVYNSPSDVDFLISSDGVSWNSVSTGYNLASKLPSVSKFGVLSSNNEVAIHWLRIRTL